MHWFIAHFHPHRSSIIIIISSSLIIIGFCLWVDWLSVYGASFGSSPCWCSLHSIMVLNCVVIHQVQTNTRCAWCAHLFHFIFWFHLMCGISHHTLSLIHHRTFNYWIGISKFIFNFNLAWGLPCCLACGLRSLALVQLGISNSYLVLQLSKRIQIDFGGFVLL